MAKNVVKQKEEQIIEKLVSVRRVTKVVKGGKNLRFSALVVVGDEKGRVGYATGKAREVPDAVKKASEKARRKMIRVPLREGRTLHHDVSAQIGAGKVFLRSAPPGTGVIAGGVMRSVFEVLGIHDVVSKSVGSSNYYSTIRATFEALKKNSSPRQIARRLDKKLSDVVVRRKAYKKGTSDLEQENNQKNVVDTKENAES
ncbi:MAG: 30S ribosomal protein S5 [Alphaproteobacteria bacterium]